MYETIFRKICMPPPCHSRELTYHKLHRERFKIQSLLNQSGWPLTCSWALSNLYAVQGCLRWCAKIQAGGQAGQIVGLSFYCYGFPTLGFISRGTVFLQRQNRWEHTKFGRINRRKRQTLALPCWSQLSFSVTLVLHLYGGTQKLTYFHKQLVIDVIL